MSLRSEVDLSSEVDLRSGVDLSSEVEWSTGAGGDAVDLRGGIGQPAPKATQLTSEVE